MKQLGRDRQDLETENIRLRARLTEYRRHAVFSGSSKILGEMIRSARVVLPFYFLWLCVRDTAGTHTTADIKAEVSGKLTVESDSLVDAVVALLTENLVFAAAIAIGIAGLWYGRFHAKQRKDDVEHLQGRRLERERSIDPRRSSNKPTARGDIPSEDA